MGIGDRRTVAQGLGERGEGGGEVDRPEDDHPGRPGERGNVHPQTASERRPVGPVGAHRRATLYHKASSLASDVVIEEGDPERPNDGAGIGVQLPPCVLATDQRGHGRWMLGPDRLESGDRRLVRVIANRVDEDVHDATAHQPGGTGQLIGDAVGDETRSSPRLEHRDRLLGHRTLHAAAGDRALDRAVRIDVDAGADHERRGAVDPHERAGGHAPATAEPLSAVIAVCCTGLNMRLSSLHGRRRASPQRGPSVVR